MIIRVEPKDFFMFAVFLIFNEQQPDPEDEPVRTYLNEHQLYPKQKSKSTHEGWDCEVMYFGGCYMGRHLSAIADLQRSIMEKELVSQHVNRIVRDEPADGVQLVASRLAEKALHGVLSELVEEFNQASSFESGEEGQIKLVLDDSTIQTRFMELAQAPRVL